MNIKGYDIQRSWKHGNIYCSPSLLEPVSGSLNSDRGRALCNSGDNPSEETVAIESLLVEKETFESAGLTV